MSTAVFSLAVAAALVGSAIGFQIRRKKERRARLKGLELRPNCLLTRYPIVFISGRRSVFRLFDHWNEIPSYLREHGYEVMILEPSLRPGESTKSITSALDEIEGKCHLIADSSFESELVEIARGPQHPAIASLTLVRNPQARRVSKGSVPTRPSISELKPLERAIETFEIVPIEEMRSPRASDFVALTLLWLHNRLLRGRRVDPMETGEISAQGWGLESRFLDLAISLAERDVNFSDQWSDRK